MTIETKYSIGDEVWFRFCGQIESGNKWIPLAGETPYFDKFEDAMEAGLKHTLKNLV